jgi:integrase
MTAQQRKRRSPGEGGAYSYKTGEGLRWYWKATIGKTDGTREPMVRRGYLTKLAALEAMAEAKKESKDGTFVEPSRQQTGGYMVTWLDGLRSEESTVASYRIVTRLHITPYIGSVPLAALTAGRIDALYRKLEREGRRDGKGALTGEGLGPATVRYVHVILSAALSAAVDAGLLRVNPAAKAHPPTQKQVMAARPEMHPWTKDQLAAFLGWAREHSRYHPLWTVLATTGMRRGEALGLHWRDLDLDAGAISIRRGARMIRYKGERAGVHEAPTKGHTARVVAIDAGTVKVLRALRKERGALALQLARDDALIFGNLEGQLRNPEHVSQAFRAAVGRCRRVLGDDVVPVIRLHDLRHTHATVLLREGVPLKVVSERLGHKDVATTLRTYAHVMPGDQQAAASLFAGVVGEGQP